MTTRGILRRDKDSKTSARFINYQHTIKFLIMVLLEPLMIIINRSDGNIHSFRFHRTEIIPQSPKGEVFNRNECPTSSSMLKDAALLGNKVLYDLL